MHCDQFSNWRRTQVATLAVAFSLQFLLQVFPLDAAEPPKVLDPDWKIESIATEPELVTPVGCCFDDQGRLLVVECHTHFPPDDYKGPKTDRIYLFDDTDDDGVPDRQRLFFEGGRATMGVVNLGDGWIGVATRSEVTRIRDTNGDDVADQSEVLVTLKTEETYPHDGLAGLIDGPDGLLYVGQGENLGAPYELIGTDGSKQIGGGEGGNIFRCTVEGKKLERIATGFWNPFGLHFDSAGRLWTVGNDPDAMPPCRLLHVVEGGDYGFQFRFGRAGTHPLLAWNGELPGTLGMTAGTGEAPCNLTTFDGQYWVTSWGDNRIERYQLEPHGASWTGKTQVVVQGDASFRPVGIVVAPDKSIYITDWVDRSYPVHGKGRIWRLRRKAGAPNNGGDVPELTAIESNAKRLATDSEMTADQRMEALASDDPFLQQAAVTGLVRTNQLRTIDRVQVTNPQQQIGLLSAWRWKELTAPETVPVELRKDWVDWGLSQKSNKVLLASIRWAAERDSKEHLPTIKDLLMRADLSPQLFSAVVASVAYLETGSASRGKRDPAIEKLLIEFAGNADRPANLRALAIRMIPEESKVPADEELSQWVSRSGERDFSMEVVRLLSARATENSLDRIAEIAADASVDAQTRADAVASLAKNASRHAVTLQKLGSPRNPMPVSEEVRRISKRAYQLSQDKRPPREDLEAWDKLISSGGNADAGRRVFFRTTCANCHAHSGRGAKTGPDLSTIAGTMTSRRFLESILEPSKEIGPLYVPYRISTLDGKVLTGLKLDKAGVGNSIRFQGADGDVFEVGLEDIEEYYPIEQSIMPAGLETLLTIDELRDLKAFLVGAGSPRE